MWLPGKKEITLIAVSTLVGVALCEALLRLMGISYPSRIAPDAYTGFAHRPNVEGWWRNEGTAAYVKINSAGFRDKEWQQEKPADVFRIAVLGDSFVQAFDVSAEKTFCSLIENSLSACPAFDSKKVEVLNFGVGGYGTAQELLTLRHKVWAYSPDLVVLAFFGGNDVKNNYRALQQEDHYPYFVERGGQLVLDDSFKESAGYKGRQGQWRNLVLAISDHLRIAEVINQARRQIYVYWTIRSEAKTEQPYEEEFGIDYRVFDEPANEDWKNARHVTERLIAQMSEEVHQHGAQFLLVSLSTGVHVHPDLKVRQALTSHLRTPDLLYVERRLGNLAERETIRIPFLPLAKPMADYAEQSGTFLHGSPTGLLGQGHWNEAGHAFAANLISQKICTLPANETALSQP